MTQRPPIPVPHATDESQLPRFRYWGDQKPPKNRSDIFSVTSEPVAAGSTPSATTEKPSAGSVATLRMYGPIDSWGGFWGISAQDVSAALDTLPDSVDQIVLRINSPGGEVWEGLTILNMLRAHKAKVTAVVDGIAASAASFIAAGCDETIMSPGTQMMIHDARTFAYGPPASIRKVAGILDTSSNSIAELYAEAAGGTAADWRALMSEETWYTSTEAVTAGLAAKVAVVPDAGPTATAVEDEPTTPPAAGAEVEDRFDLSIYAYAGRSNAPAPRSFNERTHNPPSASAVGSTPTQEGSPAVAFSDEQVTTMRQKLGIAEDADEATILAALDEVLDEQPEVTPSSPTAQIPEGHVVIPAAQLADLQAGAAMASATAKKLADQERDTFLDSVRTKYAPTNRNAWEKEYDRDPEGTRSHFATAPELIPVAELGHGGEPESNADDALYDELFATEKGI